MLSLDPKFSLMHRIRKHPAIKEVLVTGGDPFILPDPKLESLLSRLCEIDHIDCIRIGSRVLVTLPMRITDKLAGILGRFRVPGRREIAVRITSYNVCYTKLLRSHTDG